MELGRLYQEIAELVHQQEPAVEQINQGAEDVRENVSNANKQMDTAIDSARKARKWKWYALLIISELHPLGPLDGANPNSTHHRDCRRSWCRCQQSQRKQQIGRLYCVLSLLFFSDYV